MRLTQVQIQIIKETPQPSQLKAMLMLAVMLLAVGAAVFLKPTQHLANQGSKIDLETMIPKQFSGWQMDQAATESIINPQVDAQLSKIYSQTLSRTYHNSQGDRIMLSIAYGDNQSTELQVHRPEVCYTAQGFQIINMAKNLLKTSSGSIPVMQIVTQLGLRNEPITYWVRIGDDVVRGNIEQGLARLRNGLTGKVPDGLLFRVSSISSTSSTAFVLQQSFVDAMLNSMSPDNKAHLVGRLTL